jgi:hypothetical protein
MKNKMTLRNTVCWALADGRRDASGKLHPEGTMIANCYAYGKLVLVITSKDLIEFWDAVYAWKTPSKIMGKK